MKNLHYRCITGPLHSPRLTEFRDYSHLETSFFCSDVILGTKLVLLLIKDIKYNRDEKDRIQSLLHDLRQTNVPSRASCIVSVRAEQAET